MIEAEACQNANELTARIMARAGDGLISDVTVRTVRLVLLPEMEGSYLTSAKPEIEYIEIH